MALLAAGCSTLPPVAMPAALRDRTSIELTQTPFFPQRRYQCGPAALATVLASSGIEVTPDDLAAQVYLPGRKGSLQVEMLAAARRHRRVPYTLAPELPALLAEVAAGHPALVLQNLAFNWYPMWHYAVVIGFNFDARELILRSGRNRRITVPFDTFQRTWRRGHNWAIVVVEPDDPPVTAEAIRYVKAVAELERLGEYTEARRGYQAALTRWPDNSGARLGLANSAYYDHDLPAAEAQYRALLQRDPQQASVYNNLAQVVYEQGRRDEAIAIIRQAIARGGPLVKIYRRTLQQFEAQ